MWSNHCGNCCQHDVKSQIQSEVDIRMTIKDSPEHPIPAGLSFSLGRDLDDLFGVVILDRTVAGKLNQIVSQNASSSVDKVGLLHLPQLLSGLVGSDHFDDGATLVVGGLGDGALANKSASL